MRTKCCILCILKRKTHCKDSVFSIKFYKFINNVDNSAFVYVTLNIRYTHMANTLNIFLFLYIPIIYIVYFIEYIITYNFT